MAKTNPYNEKGYLTMFMASMPRRNTIIWDRWDALSHAPKDTDVAQPAQKLMQNKDEVLPICCLGPFPFGATFHFPKKRQRDAS